MTSKPDALAALLRGEWRDPESGALVTLPSLAISIERSLAGSEADLVEPLHLGRRLAVVSDRATRAVLGARVERALTPMAAIEPLTLDAEPHADAPTVAALRRATASADALVAVGSGTINDLCKYAAAQDGKPYAVFATAPSMNGYTSKNAAITVDGHKKSLAAGAPVGVFVDLTVLAAAPARMIRAGLGDSMCRPTAQADWLLSHHLYGTPYREAPFALLADDEPALLDDPEALLQHDPDAMRALARTLILSGLGMTICDGSYPASQAEHLISHCIDMRAPANRAAYFHGEQVGVATLTMARIQETVLAGGPPQLRRDAISETDLKQRFGNDVGASCWHEFDRKRLTADRLASLQRHLDTRWDDIRSSVRRAMIPAAQIQDVLRRANCAETASDIGVDDAFYAEAVRDARFLRDRYTFLDLAADSQHRDMVNAALAV